MLRSTSGDAQQQNGSDTAVRQFTADDLGRFWSWLPLDGQITEAAAKVYASLPADVFLRTADCLHLVTSLRHNFGEVHTHDQHQAAAAPALGLEAITISCESAPP